MAWTAWTTDTLAAHVRGELDVDPDAAGGTVPDRLIALVREAGLRLWTLVDWTFRRKQGTLTMVPGTETADLPDDFGELDHRWLRDVDEGATFRLTEDTALWQSVADEYESGDTGVPRLILCARDTDESDNWVWRAHMTPTPDSDYAAGFWYLTRDPWTVPDNGLSDDASPTWPPTFHAGWRLLARYGALEAFSTDDERIARAGRNFARWLTAQQAERDETVSHPAEYIERAYDDLAAFTSVTGPFSFSMPDPDKVLP
ncbi:MAG: hypothetical protein ABII82_00335 [Verrucomicrobiota bacterium]